MEGFLVVIAIAILVEALVQVLKGFAPDGATSPGWLWPVSSCVLGVMVCVLAKVDALALLGVALSVPYVGCVLTGVLVSRGSSFVHDLWQRVRGTAE